MSRQCLGQGGVTWERDGVSHNFSNGYGQKETSTSIALPELRNTCNIKGTDPFRRQSLWNTSGLLVQSSGGKRDRVLACWKGKDCNSRYIQTLGATAGDR